MSTNESLNFWQSSVAELDKNEKLAVAAFLICDCNPEQGYSLKYTPGKKSPTQALIKAFEASIQIPQSAKLEIAIELLNSLIIPVEQAEVEFPTQYMRAFSHFLEGEYPQPNPENWKIKKHES